MRTAYEIASRLMWDACFRKKFIADQREAISEYFPDYADEGLFCHTARIQGLEEEAYRRLAFIHRSSKEVFPCGHHLVQALCADDFFEQLASRFFEYRRESLHRQALEILEPFDGYLIGPMMLRLTSEIVRPDVQWLNTVLDYEWAKWHARRVANGWPALRKFPPLVPGASLVHAEFDLKSLMQEAKRLVDCSVSAHLYQWRIQPGDGVFRAAIFPRDGDVFEAALDSASFASLRDAIASSRCNVDDELRTTVVSIGLVLETSFLCCSNEFSKSNDLESALRSKAEPEPH